MIWMDLSQWYLMAPCQARLPAHIPPSEALGTLLRTFGHGGGAWLCLLFLWPVVDCGSIFYEYPRATVGYKTHHPHHHHHGWDCRCCKCCQYDRCYDSNWQTGYPARKWHDDHSKQSLRNVMGTGYARKNAAVSVRIRWWHCWDIMGCIVEMMGPWTQINEIMIMNDNIIHVYVYRICMVITLTSTGIYGCMNSIHMCSHKRHACGCVYTCAFMYIHMYPPTPADARASA